MKGSNIPLYLLTMSEIRDYYNGLTEMKKSYERKTISSRMADYDSYYNRNTDFDSGVRLFKGCVLALGTTAVIIWCIWYACRLIFG